MVWQSLLHFVCVCAAVLALCPEANARGINDSFVIGLEQPVSNGIPGPGAGNLESPGATDTYSFTIARPTTIFAQELSGPCAFKWTLTSPTNAVIFNDTTFCNTSPGLRVLTEIGTYTIVVAAAGNATGTYSFTLWNVDPAEQFTLSLEQVVSNGVPGPGAGNIEEPGAKDIYSFVIPTPTDIYAQDLSGGCSLRWKLTAPSGTTVFDDAAICITDPGVFSLTEVGTYSVTVSSASGGVGNYSFVVWALNAPQSFAISTKETVSNSIPDLGAGNIEEAGAVDTYTIAIAAPCSIYADEISGGCSLRWSMIAPSGDAVFSSDVLCVTDPGVRTLTESGDYTITVSGIEGATGTYSFRLWKLDEPQTFPLAIGEVVANGVPAAGAGNLEEPGAKDIYLVPISFPITIFADALSASCTFAWSMVAPSGQVLFNAPSLCSDPGQFSLVELGIYTVTVFSPGGQSGAYSFTLTNVNPPQQFTLSLEQIIADGVPGPGAGNIELPGSADEYAIVMSAGTQFIPEVLSGGCGLRWSLTAPSGAPVFANGVLCAAPPTIFTALESGTYTLSVFGLGAATGTYSAIVWQLDPPQQFVIAIGDSVNDGDPARGAGRLEEPGSIDLYAFSAVAGQRICFQENAGPCTFTSTLTQPDGTVVFSDPNFCGTEPGKFTLQQSGTYTIAITGNNGTYGSYGFSLKEGSLADISPASGDCLVNAADLAVLLGSWGPCRDCAADLNSDGAVDASDLALLLGDWD